MCANIPLNVPREGALASHTQTLATWFKAPLQAKHQQSIASLRQSSGNEGAACPMIALGRWTRGSGDMFHSVGTIPTNVGIG